MHPTVLCAFQRLLDAAGRTRGWQLIPKQSLKVGKATIIPDGTLRDMFQARCGFWEAKDKVIENFEFTQRNVIAAEIEEVVAALVSLSFNRDTFLKSLDRAKSFFVGTHESCSATT